VLCATSTHAQRTFYFLSKNSATEETKQRLYQRRRRGAHVTWFEYVAGTERPIVTGHSELELAYRLINDAKDNAAMRKFAALAKKHTRPRR